MPKVKYVSVVFDGGKTVYKPGDLVSGTVQIDVGVAFKVHGVRVYIYGQSLVKWDESEIHFSIHGSSVAALPRSKDFVANEQYVGVRHTVHGNISKIKSLLMS